MAHAAQPQLADAAPGERLHRPRAPELVDAHHRVEHRERPDAVRDLGGDLEADRPADVVHDEVEAADLQRVDRGERSSARARSTSSRSAAGGRRGPSPGRSNATPRSPWPSSSPSTLRHRKLDVGTPWTHTTGSPPRDAVSRTNERTPPAVNARPERACSWTTCTADMAGDTTLRPHAQAPTAPDRPARLPGALRRRVRRRREGHRRRSRRDHGRAAEHPGRGGAVRAGRDQQGPRGEAVDPEAERRAADRAARPRTSSRARARPRRRATTSRSSTSGSTGPTARSSTPRGTAVRRSRSRSAPATSSRAGTRACRA